MSYMLEIIWDLIAGSSQEYTLAFVPLLLAGLGAAAGAIAGAEDRTTKETSTSRLEMDPESKFEGQLRDKLPTMFGNLYNMTEQGTNTADVQNGANAQRDFGSLLQRFQNQGGMPGQNEINFGNSAAADLFRPQQVALNQSFEDQLIDTNQMAARLGRSVNDPILQAKLRTGLMRSQASLGAEQTKAATGLAFNSMDRQIGMGRERASVLGSLGASALNNRMTLLGLGSQLQGAERAFRMNTAKKITTGEKTQEGSFGQALMGGISGLGSGFKLGSQMSAFGGGNSSGMFSADGALSGIGGIQSNDPTAQYSLGTGFKSAPVFSSGR